MSKMTGVIPGSDNTAVPTARPSTPPGQAVRLAPSLTQPRRRPGLLRHRGKLPTPTELARRSFFKTLKKAGLPQMRFHDLRHTCATMLALANVPTKVTGERLGHGSIQVTENIYAHVLPTMQKQAADTMTTILTHATQRPLAAAVGSP